MKRSTDGGRGPDRRVAVVAAAFVAAAIAGAWPQPTYRRVTFRAVPPATPVDASEPARPEAPTWHWKRADNDWRETRELGQSSEWLISARVPRAGRLHLSWFVKPETAAVRLEIARRVNDGWERLARCPWSWRPSWKDRDVDLARFAGQVLDLRLSAHGEPAHIFVSDLQITGRVADRPRPNILFYVIDCLRSDHVGAYGYNRPTTPAIDALARESVLMEKAFSSASWTKPAVASMLTGLYPWRHGVRSYEATLPRSIPTMGEVLGHAGYATVALIANPLLLRTTGQLRGFDQAIDVEPYPENRNIIDLKADATHLTDAALAWLGDGRDLPWFMYLHSLDLHLSYRPRPPFDRLLVRPGLGGVDHERDLYDNELAANDAQLGRLIEALRRRNLLNDTIVVVTADHGEEFGEHGSFRHGHSLFDPAVHVPMIIKLPGSRDGGTRRATLFSEVDIMPTLLGLAGVTAPPGLDGRDLSDVLTGKQAIEGRTVFAEQLTAKEMIYSARNDRYKAMQRLRPQPAVTWLFDLDRDPGEQADLSGAVPDDARALVDDLDQVVTVAQTGYHLVLGGTLPGRIIEARVTAAAPVPWATLYGQVTGDTLTRSAQGLDLRFRSNGKTHSVLFDTEPPGMPVQVELSVDGAAVPATSIMIGSHATSLGERGGTVDGRSARVSPEDARELRNGATDRARLWYLAPPETDAADTESARALQSALRVLGYVQ